MDSSKCFFIKWTVDNISFTVPENKRNNECMFAPPTKHPRKRLTVNLTTAAASLSNFEWSSMYNFDGRMNCTKVEIGDGGTTIECI